jgi:hypothetical protein
MNPSCLKLETQLCQENNAAGGSQPMRPPQLTTLGQCT